MSLKTDWKDDVLDISMGGKRRYKLIENADGTFSLVDNTTYSQIGDNFSADDLNEICEEVNNVSSNLTQNYYTKTEVDNKFVYNGESEEVIGKWINGKPIYRKVISGTTPSSTNVNTQVGTVSNLDETINMYGFVDYGVPINAFNSNSSGSGGTVWFTYVRKNDNTVRMLVTSGDYTNKHLTIVVEYTKTTDSAQ